MHFDGLSTFVRLRKQPQLQLTFLGHTTVQQSKECDKVGVSNCFAYLCKTQQVQLKLDSVRVAGRIGQEGAAPSILCWTAEDSLLPPGHVG